MAGVTGWPVAHSLSPRLHGYWLNKYGIPGTYVPLAFAPEGFVEGIRGLQASGFSGVNVTVPHKLAAFEIADTLDVAAQAIGAVNCLRFLEDGSIAGSNADAAGFLDNLKDHGVDVTVGPALLYGAGGAARAALHALLQAGTPEIRLVNRSAEKAGALIRNFDDPRLHYVGEMAENKAMGDVALVVNTTSLGMKGQPPLTVDLAALPDTATVHDIVYVPLKTDLLRQAVGRKLQVVDGLGMLLHQAVPAFEAFFGTRPVVDAGLRNHMLEAL